MTLLIESIMHQWDGTIDLSIIIIDKIKRQYSFTIASNKILDEFRNYCKKKCFGKALNLIKKYNINQPERRKNEENTRKTEVTNR